MIHVNSRIAGADTIAINVSDLTGGESTIGGDGGIVGRIQGAEVTISDCEVQKTSIAGGKSGGVVGVVGNTAVTVKLQNCVVNGTEDQKYKITGEETAGGMIGLSTAPNKKIQMKQCEVSNMKMISNKWDVAACWEMWTGRRIWIHCICLTVQ